MPKAVEAKVAELKATLKGEAEEPQKEEAKKELDELQERQVRLSGQTQISMAVLVDGMIKELLVHGMKKAADGAPKKMVHVANFHSEEVEALKHYPIFEKCASWRGYSPEKEAALEAARTAQNKQAKQEREAAKAAKAAQEAGPAGPAPQKGEKAKKQTERGATFTTYVDNALQEVKKDPAFAAMRVSGRVKEYVSDLVQEVVVRLAMLSKFLVQEVMEVKTLTTEHVVAVVSMIMLDAGKGPEEIEEVLAPVKGGLESFKAHQQAEKTVKLGNMTPEKSAQLEEKKAEAEKKRLAHQAEQTRARALAFARKAKELQEACAVAGIEVGGGAGAPAAEGTA
jgi:hypothetical protein